MRKELIKRFDVRTPSPETHAGSLSGGNQQKMVVAREFSRPIKLLIASQPTRGIDVGSIEFIHNQIVRKRDDGVAVLLVSSELDEIMALSDRIVVMYKGEIIGTVPRAEATREGLGLLMAGVRALRLPRQLNRLSRREGLSPTGHRLPGAGTKPGFAAETWFLCGEDKLCEPNELVLRVDRGLHWADVWICRITARRRAFAVFAHCFGCTKNLKTIGNVDRVLTDAGIGVLRFDFTGLGDSEGDFSDTNFTSNVSDVGAAARFLAENYEAPRLLIGHSLGGAAVMQAAKTVQSAAAVVTIAAPADLSHLGETIVSQAPEIEQTGEAEVVLIGRRFHIKKQFIDDLEQGSMEQIVGSSASALAHPPRAGG